MSFRSATILQTCQLDGFALTWGRNYYIGSKINLNAFGTAGWLPCCKHLGTRGLQQLPAIWKLLYNLFHSDNAILLQLPHSISPSSCIITYRHVLIHCHTNDVIYLVCPPSMHVQELLFSLIDILPSAGTSDWAQCTRNGCSPKKPLCTVGLEIFAYSWDCTLFQCSHERRALTSFLPFFPGPDPLQTMFSLSVSLHQLRNSHQYQITLRCTKEEMAMIFGSSTWPKRLAIPSCHLYNAG